MKFLKGIPYFGKENNEVYQEIQNIKLSEPVNYESFYELIQNECTENKVVVISRKWISYLRDICLDYKHRVIFTPYYTYDVMMLDDYNIRGTQNGHLILKDDTIGIRYNYSLERQYYKWENGFIILYDLHTHKKYKATWKKLFNETEFSMQKLYELYTHSCYKEDDYLIIKHTEGYHLIDRKLNTVTNKERTLRKEFALPDFKSFPESIDYRDVREFSRDKMIQEIGFELIQDERPYWKRRIDFESYLFCSINSKVEPIEDDVKREYKKLKRGKRILKYGSEIKLILKDYWLNSNKDYSNYTWFKR